MTPISISILHRDGSATLPLAGASKEIREQFGYSAAKALAYEELKAAHEESAQEIRLQKQRVLAKPTTGQVRKPHIVELAETSISWLQKIFSKPPEPAPAPTPDPGFVRNRREMIRFYERAIQDLENLNRQRASASSRDSSGSLLPRSEESCRVWSRSPASDAHNKQIEEYRARIAKLKLEIGE